MSIYLSLPLKCTVHCTCISFLPQGQLDCESPPPRTTIVCDFLKILSFLTSVYLLRTPDAAAPAGCHLVEANLSEKFLDNLNAVLMSFRKILEKTTGKTAFFRSDAQWEQVSGFLKITNACALSSVVHARKTFVPSVCSNEKFG